MAIIAGLWNSGGQGGVNTWSNYGKNTPQQTAWNYMHKTEKATPLSEPHPHRKKRIDAINKHFPCGKEL